MLLPSAEVSAGQLRYRSLPLAEHTASWCVSLCHRHPSFPFRRRTSISVMYSKFSRTNTIDFLGNWRSAVLRRRFCAGRSVSTAALLGVMQGRDTKPAAEETSKTVLRKFPRKSNIRHKNVREIHCYDRHRRPKAQIDSGRMPLFRPIVFTGKRWGGFFHPWQRNCPLTEQLPILCLSPSLLTLCNFTPQNYTEMLVKSVGLW